MIFVTLGSQKFQFDRLLKKIDSLIEVGVLKEDIFAQIGYSRYKPSKYQYECFIDRNEFEEWMNKSDIVITHGGTGIIISALKMRKKVIAVPRLAKYDEHIDNHQVQLIEELKDMNLIYGCESCDEITEALKVVKDTTYSSYSSNTKRVLDSIRSFIESV